MSVNIHIQPASAAPTEAVAKTAKNAKVNSLKELTISDVSKTYLVNFAADPKIPNPPLSDAIKFVERKKHSYYLSVIA